MLYKTVLSKSLQFRGSFIPQIIRNNPRSDHYAMAGPLLKSTEWDSRFKGKETDLWFFADSRGWSFLNFGGRHVSPMPCSLRVYVIFQSNGKFGQKTSDRTAKHWSSLLFWRSRVSPLESPPPLLLGMLSKLVKGFIACFKQTKSFFISHETKLWNFKTLFFDDSFMVLIMIYLYFSISLTFSHRIKKVRKNNHFWYNNIKYSHTHTCT